MTKKYDSTEDTKKHIEMVQQLMFFASQKLKHKSKYHDASKLRMPEKRIFDEYTPKLKNTTYGSDEYKKYLESMKYGLDHHYRKNKHHPEHFEHGIYDMNLLDLIEMFIDWMAATKRHADGDINKSIKINKDRFGYDDLLENIFENTVKVFEHFYLIFELFDKDDKQYEDVRTIVYDYWNGENIYTDEYKEENCWAEKIFEKANSIILTLVSMGLG